MPGFDFMRRFAGLALALGLVLPAVSAYATDPANTGMMLKMSSDRSLLIRLPSDAKTVVVANPAHLTAMLDNPRLMILVPGEAGTTSLTVLDRKGEVIFDRDVVVSAIGPRQLRITRSCNVAGGAGCAPTTIMDCTDGCVTVSAAPTVTPQDTATIAGSGQPSSGAATGSSSSAGVEEDIKSPPSVDLNLQ